TVVIEEPGHGDDASMPMTVVRPGEVVVFRPLDDSGRLWSHLSIVGRVAQGRNRRAGTAARAHEQPRCVGAVRFVGGWSPAVRPPPDSPEKRLALLVRLAVIVSTEPDRRCGLHR